MMTKTTILIVNEDKEYINQLKTILISHNYDVIYRSSAEQALATLQQDNIDLLITNFQMSLVNSNKLYKIAQAQYPLLPILITTHSTVLAETLVASQKGVFGFITKPCDKKQLLELIRNALTTINRSNNNDWKSSILTCNVQMKDILDQAHHVAESKINIVIQGEKGAGKSLLAESIHGFQINDNKPFIHINCNKLDEDELNSQLLNHLNRDTKATIFFDDIDKLASPLQHSLLTSLQSCQRAIAVSTNCQSDLRVICASTVNLEDVMLSGYFDRELFYLLNVTTINLPALRHRVEDIPILARHFLAKHSLRHNRKVRNISPGALHLLAKATWPGNVRELSEVIKQAVIENTSPVISEKAICGKINDTSSAILSFSQARAEFERNYLIKVLQLTEGNVTHAARIAERNRTDFYKLLSKYELSATDYKAKSSNAKNNKLEKKMLG